MPDDASTVTFRGRNEKGGIQVQFGDRMYLFYQRNGAILSIYQQVDTRTGKFAWRLVWQPGHRGKVLRALQGFIAAGAPRGA
jgi:hypothetical protein